MKKELINTIVKINFCFLTNLFQLGSNSSSVYEEYEKWTSPQRMSSSKTENFNVKPIILEVQSPSYLEKKVKKKTEDFEEEDERKISLDLFSDDFMMREFLKMKASVLWKKSQKTQDIKIQH